jgi:hypothetical protein
MTEPAQGADTVVMTERQSKPFRFTVGQPNTRDGFTAVSGEVVWGQGGWLVTDGDAEYQASGDESQTEAVLNWLSQRLIDGRWR